jgi:hypothetical protein
MSKETDPAWERLRIMVGLALVLVCGTYLYRERIRPVLERGPSKVWEARGKMRDQLVEWAREQKAEEARPRSPEKGAGASGHAQEGVTQSGTWVGGTLGSGGMLGSGGTLGSGTLR